MAEEKKERWMTYRAITTIMIAVAATLSVADSVQKAC